jgi:hypothetical protein
MRNTKSFTFAFALLLATFARGASAAPDQPEMQAALADLQKARAELRLATPDKGGHRANAIKLVDAAIAEVNAGIRFDRRHDDEDAFAVALAPVAAVDQPHMQAALDALRDARTHLDAATPDKGGHRVKAIEDVNNAIDQVQKGIEFDRTH